MNSATLSNLNIDKLNQFELNTQTLVGRSIAILGITGSGKTNTTAVLVEELLSNGFPLTIVDIEGEYWGLKEKFEILVAGRSDNVDIEVGIAHAEHLAQLSVDKDISIVLDLSDFGQDEMFEFLLLYFKTLWVACSASRQPYQIVLEEAHEFVPQSVRTPLKEILTRIALRGRKRGLGIIMVSQRSAKVEKDLLTQTSLLFLHRVVHPVDLKVYADLIPLPNRQVDEMVGRLHSGEAIVLYNHEVTVVQIRLRETFNAGATPSLTTSALPKLRRIDKAVLEELKKITAKSGLPETDEKAKLSKRIKELKDLALQKDEEIRRLQAQVVLLSNLKLSLDTLPLNSNPQKLEIDEAYINRFITSEKTEKLNGGYSAPVSAPPVQKEIPTTSVEQRRVEAIVRRVQKLPRLERSILRVLVEHEGISMTVATLATWLNLKESTIRNRPPLDLIKLGLIKRTSPVSKFAVGTISHCHGVVASLKITVIPQ